jgi:hypothetical protein
MESRHIGNNVEASVDGDWLIIRIDLSRSLGESKSGKSRLIASTNGNALLPGGTRVGVNVFVPRDAR